MNLNCLHEEFRILGRAFPYYIGNYLPRCNDCAHCAGPVITTWSRSSSLGSTLIGCASAGCVLLAGSIDWLPASSVREVMTLIVSLRYGQGLRRISWWLFYLPERANRFGIVTNWDHVVARRQVKS